MLGGPTTWSFATGFGSAGVPGWGGGIGDAWFFGSGAPNVFRYGGSYALFPLGNGASKPTVAPSVPIPPIPAGISSISPSVPSADGAPILSKQEQLRKEQAILEAIIIASGVGTGTLEPIDEEKWGEIIRIPVPKPSPSPSPVTVVDVDAIVGKPTDPSSTPQVKHEQVQESDMAVDWGTIFSGIVSDVSGAAFAPAGVAPPGFVYGKPTYTGPGSPPSGPGVYTGKCKRRRRRRLLTESDFNDLMRISTLPNKEGVRIALAKAIGRSR